MAADRTPNSALADVIAESGATYYALAREIRSVAAEAGQQLGTGPSAVAYWVAGGTPSGQTPFYIAEALTRRTKRRVTVAEIGLGSSVIGGALEADLLAAIADLGRSVMQRRRDFLGAAFTAAVVGLPLAYDHEAVAATLKAAETGASVGPAEVTTVRHLTETFRSVDERMGGGHGLTTVTAYLTDTVAPMLTARFPSAAVRSEAFGAAAQLACLVGWKHHDLGREGAAQQYGCPGAAAVRCSAICRAASGRSGTVRPTARSRPSWSWRPRTRSWGRVRVPVIAPTIVSVVSRLHW